MGRFYLHTTPGKRDSGDWIELRGIVTRLLADDDTDSERHQRFIVRLGSGQTVLVAHNLTLSERVPLGIGDRIRVRGIYEYDERGGTVHWTHADPMDAEDDGGWIEYRRIRYGR